MSRERNAKLLGLAGLIPFWSLSLLALLAPDPGVSGTALGGVIAWGAIILSFMSGARWAMTLTSEVEPDLRLALFGALPAVALAVVFLSAFPALALLIASFCGLLALELTPRSRIESPDWYPRLRVQLTAAAVLALGLAATIA